MGDEFPAEISQFIDQHIDSLAQLEALVLLRGDRARNWQAVDVAKALYVTLEMAEALLNDLVRRGFLKTKPTEVGYFYEPADVENDRMLGELAAFYQERHVAVISLIYSRPINKVQTFADAFRLRKENPP